MDSFGVGLNGTVFKSSKNKLLNRRQIAQLLTSPSELYHLFVFGDSRQTNIQVDLMKACPEIAWSGTDETFSNALDNTGWNAEPSTFVPGDNPIVSPLIGGSQTWFPWMPAAEMRSLGALTAGNTTNCTLVRAMYSGGAAFNSTDYPHLWGRLQGYAAKLRTIYYRHAGGIATLPGYALHLRTTGTNFVGSGNYPATHNDTMSGLGFTANNTGTGYGQLEITIPNTHNWATNPTTNIELLGKPNTATVLGEIFACTRIWIESVRPGIVYHNCSLSGRSIDGFLNVANSPLAAYSDLLPLFGENRIFWIDLGTNNQAGNTQVQHEAKLIELINRIRVGSPNAPILLTTAYPSSASGPNPYYKAAAIAVGARIPSVLVVDTYAAMPDYTTGVGLGYYGDTVHYNATGKAALFATIGDLILSIS